MREEFLERMAELAASYTPNWRLNEAQPDMGSALAILYAGVLEDTLRKYKESFSYQKDVFFSVQGAVPRKGSCATGHIVFGLSSSDMPEAVVPSGMIITAKHEDGHKAEYVLLQDAYVSSARIDQVLSHEGTWYLRFNRPPVAGVIQLLWLFDQTPDIRGNGYLFYYKNGDSWKELWVQDETEGFSHSGIVSFMGSSSFGLDCIFGVEGFWIKIVSERKDGIGLALPTVYINAGMVTARLPGVQGNMPVGAKLKLGRTLGFVTILKNPTPWWGGVEAETESECMERCGAALRHQSKAVTPKDFERLAREADRNLCKVRCYPGYRSTGEKMSGAVTVVVLQNDFMEGRRYFYKTRDGIEDYLRNYMAAGINSLQVTAPWFIWIDVKTVLQIDNCQWAMEVKGKANAELMSYLNPVLWPIGAVPCNLQIKHMLQRIPHVVFVKQLCLLCWLDKEGRRCELDSDAISSLPWVLPVSGSHEISITID